MKTAIVYYSMSGNTAITAEKLAEGTGADLIRIAPEKAYPDRGFRKFLWGGKSAVMAETPVLQPYTFDAEQYDLVILGFPVWAGSFAPPLRTFVQENKEVLRGRKIAAFACQSGSGAEKAFRKLQDSLGTNAFTATLILIDPKSRPKEDNDRKIADFMAKLTEKDRFATPGPF